tara:strand:+ start:757 stop:1002 length:246 start_codon:yes stop_codon:yes gene_type:complete
VKCHWKVHRAVTPAVVGSSPTAPVFLQSHNYYVETAAELLILAMSMFLAAFFCFRVLLLPDNIERTINKIDEVEQTVQEQK